MTEETESKSNTPQWPSAVSAPRTITLKIRGPLAHADLEGLLARACALLADGTVDELRCEIADVAPDAVTVDVLARLVLAAGRRGAQVRMSGVSEELRALVAFMGLADVLRE
jgi:ABC-type transporter Mla MlaB component